MKIYGKSYGDVASIKTNFVKGNDSLLKESRRIADLYSRQPKRMTCKCCEEALSDLRGFSSHDINYYICENCGHVNGEFLETSDFTRGLYEEGENYGKVYRMESREDYLNRVRAIYTPKADFLQEVLKSHHIDYKKFRFLDVGAGSGYYVEALLNAGLSAIGIEVSVDQVSYGNRMLKEDRLICMDENRIPLRIEQAEEEVISFIGVLEHMIDPHTVLKAVHDNKNIKYVFFSVPMFSYSAIWEAVSPTVFNRQLGGGHTHLFTESSLSFLCKKYDLEVMGEWRFGTDVADLFRNVFVKLEQENNQELARIYKEHFLPILDDLQLIIDKSNFCSEIHVVAKKKID